MSNLGGRLALQVSLLDLPHCTNWSPLTATASLLQEQWPGLAQQILYPLCCHSNQGAHSK